MSCMDEPDGEGLTLCDKHPDPGPGPDHDSDPGPPSFQLIPDHHLTTAIMQIRGAAEPAPEVEQAMPAAASAAAPAEPPSGIATTPAFSEWVAAHSDVTNTTPKPAVGAVAAPMAAAMVAAEADVIVVPVGKYGH